MNIFDIDKLNNMIPSGFIVFISGVTGTGKSTLSNELLRTFDTFRIIEETDLIRETLRGYGEYLQEEFGDKIKPLLESKLITGHKKILTFDDTKQQCLYMRKSIEKIVERQQRRKIPSIINGVHIVPEILDGILGNRNVIYLNLYVDNQNEIYNRLFKRDPSSFTLDYISMFHETNIAIYLSTLKLSRKIEHLFNNINVTNLNAKEVLGIAIEQISKVVKMQKL